MSELNLDDIATELLKQREYLISKIYGNQYFNKSVNGLVASIESTDKVLESLVSRREEFPEIEWPLKIPTQ